MASKLICLSIIVSTYFLSACKTSNDDNAQQPPPKTITNRENINTTQKQNYNVFVFPLDTLNPKKGFGYDILIDGSRFIHQTNIPSIQGNNGFDTKEKAEAVAQLMIYKLEHNIMPPSISKKELDSLHILN